MSDEIRITSPTGGQKGQKEVQAHHLPWEGLSEVHRVSSFGAEKYADYNFREGYAWSLGFDAANRHLGAWWNGEGWYEEESPKTGKMWRIHHLANAAWHCIVLLFFEISGRYDQYDDRPWVTDIKRQIKEAYGVHGVKD